MCLDEKLTYSIKIKSKNCEMFIMQKEHFLKLFVKYKEFIVSFLHNAFIRYLRFNEEKNRIISELEYALMSKEGIKPSSTDSSELPIDNTNTNNGFPLQNETVLSRINEEQEQATLEVIKESPPNSARNNHINSTNNNNNNNTTTSNINTKNSLIRQNSLTNNNNNNNTLNNIQSSPQNADNNNNNTTNTNNNTHEGFLLHSNTLTTHNGNNNISNINNILSVKPLSPINKGSHLMKTPRRSSSNVHVFDMGMNVNNSNVNVNANINPISVMGREYDDLDASPMPSASVMNVHHFNNPNFLDFKANKNPFSSKLSVNAGMNLVQKNEYGNVSQNAYDKNYLCLSNRGGNNANKSKIMQKFENKVEKMIIKLEKNKCNFDACEYNPRDLLVQLKNETDMTRKNIIFDKLEQVLNELGQETSM